MGGLVRRWERRQIVAALACALTLALTSPVDAEGDAHLASARAAMEALDYKTARTALVDALASGTNGPAELTEIYLLSGVVSGSLGDPAAAVLSFKRLLALSPSASLVAGTSPRVTKPFAEASAFAKSAGPLKVSVVSATTPPMVTLVVDSDPAAMVVGARVTVISAGEPDQTLDGKGAGKIEVALPAGRRLEVRVVAVDEHGNRVAEPTAAAPIVIDAPQVKVEPPKPVIIPPSPPSPAARPLYAKWWLWGGVAVAAAATGTMFGLAARSAGDDLDALNRASLEHDFGEAQDTLSRARRNALISNIAFGAAGATAIAAAILLFTEPAHPRERSITVAPVPLRGGSAITLEVPF